VKGQLKTVAKVSDTAVSDTVSFEIRISNAAMIP